MAKTKGKSAKPPPDVLAIIRRLSDEIDNHPHLTQTSLAQLAGKQNQGNLSRFLGGNAGLSYVNLLRALRELGKAGGDLVYVLTETHEGARVSGAGLTREELRELKAVVRERRATETDHTSDPHPGANKKPRQTKP